MRAINQGDYKVVEIKTLLEFNHIRDSWNQLYTEDKHSNFFVSWEWLNNLFLVSDINWFILAVQKIESDEYVAFFQFSMEKKSFKRLPLWGLLRLGAFPLSDYSGMLCKPELEKPVIELLTKYLCDKINWDKFFITNIADPRVQIMFSYFSENNYRIEINPKVVTTHIALPNTWELYLKESIGKQTRKTFVRLLKRLKENVNFKITNVSAETLTRDVDVLFELWLNKWGVKSHSEMDKKIFKHLFDLGIVELNILWENQTPIAAQGLIHDPTNKTIYAYATGFNPDYVKFSPGNMIGLYSIKRAIENGFKFYDFYRGEDSYKLSFGAERKFSTTGKVTNKRLKTYLVIKLLSLKKK